MPRKTVRVRSYKRRDGTQVSSYNFHKEASMRKDITKNFDMQRCINYFEPNQKVENPAGLCKVIYDKWKNGQMRSNPFPQRKR